MAEAQPIESLSVGQRVYYHHQVKGWTLGRLTLFSPAERRAEILDEATQTQEKMTSLHLIHGFIENSYDPQDPELFRVGDLHVATLLYCVKARCEQLKLQYSRMGDMILSVNPFQPMPFNADQERKKYLDAPDPFQLPPHVWQIAQKAFTQIIVRGQGNQSVVISGESGSGKTENTKMLINYLGQLSFKHSCNAAQRAVADRVSDRLKWSNPILESFGNARTVRNDNSSRFGKYTKLFFDPVSGVMVGGEMVTYLLEKSRIVSINKGERNYHVFYEMLAGLTPQQKQSLGGLKSAGDYKSLARGEILTRRGVDGREVNDSREFQVLVEAFSHMGLTEQEQWSIFKTLAAILHLQDMQFGADDNDKATILDSKPMEVACELLGISITDLKPSFLEKSKSRILTLLASKTEAEGLRDAFCKALYVGLFDHLVSRVNSAIQPAVSPSAASYKYVGVLDIFGFENFARNSFEQMCINFANEGLQNHYNKYTFLNDEEECRAEGIQCPQVTFPDNSACLQLFDTPKTGIFALLDEECSVKTGTSQNYTTNVWNLWTSKNAYFVRPKSTIPNEFGIRHYASFVTYNTEEWLEKNVDALKEEAKKAVQASHDAFIRRLMDTIEAISSDGQMKRRVTVASRFQVQLQSLRGELESTESHFIRCVKPNMQAMPAVMENLYVGAQLESAGVLQTIALKRQGYPVRRPLATFSGYFSVIAPRKALRLHQQRLHGEAVKLILDHYQSFYRWRAPNFAVGKSKVFLRANIWSTLEKLLIRRKRYLLKRVVPFLKRWVVNFRARKAEEERRRLEQQRLLQQQAAQREQEAKGGIDFRATALKSGLDAKKAQWFEELAVIFIHFDLPVLMDVIYNLTSKEQALKALTEMQSERLEETLPVMLRRMCLQELRIRPSVVENFAAKGIVSLANLAQLSTAQLQSLGMNHEEITRLNQVMLSQQSEVVVNERLRETVGQQGSIAQILGDRGTGSAGALAGPRTAPQVVPPPMQRGGSASGSFSQAPSAAAAGGVSTPTTGGGGGADMEAKIKRLTDLGYSRDVAIDAIGKCRGNVQHASDFLMAGGGTRRSSATPSTHVVGAPSSPSGAARVGTPLAESGSGGGPSSRPTSAAGSPHQAGPQSIIVPPRIIPPSTRPPPPGATTGVPASQIVRLDAPVMGTVVTSQQPGTPSSASSGSPATVAGSPQLLRSNSGVATPSLLDPKKIDHLVQMGFDRTSAANALNASRGDLQGAINRLLR